jgi:hypothetical protein
VPPDSVRCTRVNQLKLLSFGFPRRSSAIIHRTVRCTSGATAICGQRLTLTDEQCSTVSRQKPEQEPDGAPDSEQDLSGAPPDCPVAPLSEAPTVGTQRPGVGDRYPPGPLEGQDTSRRARGPNNPQGHPFVGLGRNGQ